MNCLHCGEPQRDSTPSSCHSCGGTFRTVPGLFGVNHISQLLQALEDFKAERCSAEEVRERFLNFFDVWDLFADKWGLQDQAIRELFQLGPHLEGVYGKLLDQMDEGLDHLQGCLDFLDDLEEAGPEELAELESQVHLFSRRICSAGAGLFTKLENQGGHFGALLEALEPT